MWEWESGGRYGGTGGFRYGGGRGGSDGRFESGGSGGGVAEVVEVDVVVM